VQAAASASASGGALPSGTYYYEVTAITGTGETTASNEQVVAVTGPTGSVAVNWSAVAGATGYNIYRGTSTGGEVRLVALAGGTTTSFVDTGGAVYGTVPATNTAGISPPTQSAPVAGASGGVLASGTYYYVVSAMTASGETTPSNEQQVTVTGPTGEVTVGWTAIAGATGYNIYRGMSSGGEDTLVAHLSGAAASFVDTGAAATPPAADMARINAPVLQSVIAATTGGAIATGTYYYVVTAITAVSGADPFHPMGETTASNELSAAVTGPTGSVTLTWNAVPGAVDYQVYRGTAPGTEKLVLNVGASGGGSVTATDTVTSAVMVTPPATNSANLPSPPVQNNPILSPGGGGLSVGAYYYEITATTALGETMPRLSPPALSAEGNNVPGTLSPGLYYYVMTAMNANGETMAGNERIVSISAVTGEAGLFWQAIPGATGYRIYRGTSPGGENVLLASVSDATTSYLDNGSASGVPGLPPATNTASNERVAAVTRPNGEVALNWSSILGATGYNIYRGTSPGGENVLVGAVSGATVSFVDTGGLPGIIPAVVANEDAGPQLVPNFASSISASGTFPTEANEAGQTVHFNVTGNTNPTLFATPPAIDANGVLTYSLAANASGSAQITVVLIDNAGSANGGANTSAPQSFTITANFVNDAPSITRHGANPVVKEDSGPTSIAGWAAASPGPGANEAGQSLSYIVQAANPALFTVQPAIDASGNLTFTPATHAFGTSSVTVKIHDDGGTANGGVDTSPATTFHIEIDETNHAPTVANPLAPVTVNENASDFLFGNDKLSALFDDIDVDLGRADALTLSLAGNDNPGLLSARLSSSSPATAQLDLHFLTYQSGVAHLDLRATDLSGATVDDIVLVTVNPVNQVPTFTVGGNQRVTINSGAMSTPWATNISPGAPNETNQTLNFVVSIASTTNPALFSVAPAIDANGNLTFTPAAGQTGKATISVALHDNGGTANGGSDASAAQSFTIEVDAAPVAQDHAFVLSVGPSSSAAANVGVVVGDSDPNGLPLTATIVSQAANGTVQLNSDGSFTYTKGPNFQGIDSFTYQVSDGAMTSNVATVNITSYEATIVTKLYNQVLNRPPETQGLEHWVNLIQQGQPYSVIAQGIFESDERIDPIISGYYQQFLLRPADAQGLTFWAGVWRSFGGPEPVIAGMISSNEFYASAGKAHPDLSANAAWVTALYERLLNREPDAAGLQFWTGKLDSGALDRTGVVNGFENSVEHYQNVTIAFYQQYLGREPTSSELSSSVAAFEAGGTQRTLQIGLIDSTEYRNSPPPPKTGGVNRLS
jgi:hypothetical protein